jgi:hypothetical protein
LSQEELALCFRIVAFLMKIQADFANRDGVVRFQPVREGIEVLRLMPMHKHGVHAISRK